MQRNLQFSLSTLLLAATAALAPAQARREICFPDLPGRVTLVCDFHMHSVFSDGQVWPTVRVDEAWRLGLDAIALTDHIEYQPHRDDVPTNHDRPYALARERALQRGILLPMGTEITRDTPPGHFNAIFLDSVVPLDTKDLFTTFEQANAQRAFTFWNHHDWKGEQRGSWLEVHTQLHERGLLHGMEVVNGSVYYPRAHQWCLDKGLTMIGNSDIHEPDRGEASTSAAHRSVTLVFAEERSLPALRDALFAGRTVVWFGNTLIGKREWLAPLFAASVRVDGPYLRTDKHVFVGLENTSDVDFVLAREGNVGPAALTLAAGTKTLVKIAVKDPKAALTLAYTATNLWIAPQQGMAVQIEIPGQ
jgi:hypothetical protein